MITIPTASEAELRRARRFGDLVWADGNLFAYNYRGNIYVMEPPPGITEQLIGILETHPAYAETDNVELSEDAPIDFDFNEMFPMFIIDMESVDTNDVDWEELLANPWFMKPGAIRVVHEDEELKMEYIPPQEIYAGIFGPSCQAETETAPVSEVYDPAVLMHNIHEMAFCLRECEGLLSAQLVNRPFTMAEHNAVLEAKELLETYAEEFGVDFKERSLSLEMDEDGDRTLKLG